MILKNGKRIDSCSDTVPIGSLNPFLGTTAPFGYLICQGQLVSKTTYPELYAICGSTFGTETAMEFYLPDLRGQTIAGYKEGDSTFGTLGGLIGSKTINYTPAGNASGTTVTLNDVTLSHSGGAVQGHKLTAAESGLPEHTHKLPLGAQVGVGGKSDIPARCNTSGDGNFRSGRATGTNTDTNDYGAPAIGGSSASSSHTHGFTQPNQHSFTPTTKTVTDPTFTGTQATLDNIQPTAVLNWIVKAVMLIPNQSTVVNSENDSQTNVYSCDYMNTILEQIKREAFDFAHPVGSYYETSSATWNPTAAGWYGTWVEDTQGRSTIARGTPTQNNNINHGSISEGELGWNFQLGNTLGEYNHQLTIAEMPSHNHRLNLGADAGWTTIPKTGAAATTNGTDAIYNTGGNGTHNNIHPSIVVIRWHRIA